MAALPPFSASVVCTAVPSLLNALSARLGNWLCRPVTAWLVLVAGGILILAGSHSYQSRLFEQADRRFQQMADRETAALYQYLEQCLLPSSPCLAGPPGRPGSTADLLPAMSRWALLRSPERMLLLFEGGTTPEHLRFATPPPRLPAQPARHQAGRVIDLAGQHWTLRFSSLPEAEAETAQAVRLVTLALLLVDVLLFAMLRVMASHRQATARANAEYQRAEAEIRSLAFYDPLTGLPNRRLLLDRLHQAVAASLRTQQYGALLFLDLDNFKTLNDSLGHEVGDQLLVQVAQRLCANVRESDSVARLGGDEFVIVIESLGAQLEEAQILAEGVARKLISAISSSYQLDEHECRCTGSIGITLFCGHRARIDELLRQADLAMYQAKEAGRNGVRFFEQTMQADITARSRLEHELYTAVEDDQFRLYYQPQIDAAGRCIGVEALIRWQHPARGFVSPASFIPLAEDTGLILPIGHWVLREACARLLAWQDDLTTAHLTIAVNVSAQQFRLPVFVEELASLIRFTGANPARLKLEITESMLLDNLDDAIAKISALRALGISFSLDDFGTGYSSLSYLKRLPVDQVKIDQSFVRDVLVDANDAAICRAVIALGKSLGLKVIAEGVETAEQWAFLAAEGCDEAQGYLYARPLPEADLLNWLHMRGDSSPAGSPE